MPVTAGKLKTGVKQEDLAALSSTLQFAQAGGSKAETQDTGIGTLFPQSKVVPAQGENITITPFKFGRLPEVLVAAAPLFMQFKEVGRDNAITKPTAEQVLTFITQNRVEVVQLIAVFVERDASWVAACTTEELINLFGAVLEVNTDFFIQNLIPAFANLLNVGAAVIDKLKPFLGSMLHKHS